jgi:phosphoribosylformimino-5-aminoimidazole carboxamide ribotide isomerase
MIVMPAIDLRDGACVQLVGGSYDDERVRLPDPLTVAQRWLDAGFESLHVVDLDAATDRGENDAIVARLLSLGCGRWQVGGGVRSKERIAALFAAGASRVVVGTRAIESPEWLEQQAARWPERIVLALDVKGGRPATHGWARTTDAALEDMLREASELTLAAVLVTAVDVEGQQGGCDLTLVERVQSATTLPVIASGGIASPRDLASLEERGVWAAVVGMALYSGTLDAERVAEKYGR